MKSPRERFLEKRNLTIKPTKIIPLNTQSQSRLAVSDSRTNKPGRVITGTLQLPKVSNNPNASVQDYQLLNENGFPIMSLDGRKAVLSEWYWQPLRGQPRRVDTTELRRYAASQWINSCVNTRVDQIATMKYDFVPKEEYQDFTENPMVQVEMLRCKEFFNIPNRNKESFRDILRALLKDVFEIDAGVLVKGFSVDSYDFQNTEPVSNQPQLKPTGQRILTELYARDGATFLKEVDRWGYVRGYWQYSYSYPSMPIWFNHDEIVYMMEHPSSRTPYGYSIPQALLEVIKTLQYSVLYNKNFFEQGAIPPGALALLDTSDEELKRMQQLWNNSMQGKPFQIPFINKKVEFVNFGFNMSELQFLETQMWYQKLVISSFKLTPSELGFTEDVNKSSGNSQAEVMRRRGIRPVLEILQDKINKEILPELGVKYIEFRFVEKDPVEEMQKRQMEEIDIRNGLRTVNEVRRDRGLDPLPGGDTTQGSGFSVGYGMSGLSLNNPNLPEEKKPEEAPKEDQAQEGEMTKGYKQCINCDKLSIKSTIKCKYCSGKTFNTLKKKYDLVKEYQYFNSTPLMPEIMNFLNQYEFSKISDITQKQKNLIRLTFVQAFKEGWGTGTLTKALTEIVKDEVKAELITKFETAEILTQARLQRADRLGIDKFKFLAQPDVEKDHTCAKLDRKVFTKKELNESNTPPLHPRCRCRLDEVIEV